MNRITETFKRLQEKNEKALITYITAGDPSLEDSLAIMHSLVRSHADIIELGFPFSEPMADGPVIQRAIERSLAAHTNLLKVIELVKQFRETNKTTPIVLMGYLNPVYHLGYENFANLISEAGVDGVLIVDCPVEYIGELHQKLKVKFVESIFLITPTTSTERVRMIAEHAGGFLYYVSVKGITGSSTMDVKEVTSKLQKFKPETKLPIAVGFGIKTPEDVRQIVKVADGVVVGSRIIELIEAGHVPYAEVAKLVTDLKQATV